MSILQYDKVIKYRAEITCDGPLHIGGSGEDKEQILVHPVNGLPFIQASGLAGVFRSSYEQYLSDHTEKKVQDLFGAALEWKDQSWLRFSDGVFEKKDMHMERRAHVRIDRKSGSVASEQEFGQKFDMEYIGAGAKFIFNLYLYMDEEDTADRREAVEMLFAGMKNGDMTIGAKKSSGAGRIHLSRLDVIEFSMRDENDRALWIREEDLPETEYRSILDQLSGATGGNRKYQVILSGETEGAVQIRGIAVSRFGEGAPDSENIRNAEKDYIIPGSSLRGVIRSQMEKIAGYIIGADSSDTIEQFFGRGGESGGEGKSGNLVFADSVIGTREANEKAVLRHRIHIDKFTGGVFDKEIFSEKNAYGDVQFKIDIRNKNNPDAALGLVLLALRDLAVHTLSVGNGFANGKGFINVKNITVLGEQNQQLVSIDIEEQNVNTADPAGVIKKSLTALRGVKA